MPLLLLERIGERVFHRLNEVTTTMQDFVRQGKIAGAVTMVSQPDRTVYCEAVGQQNIEADLPMRRNTIFRIHSMTKPITSVAALILADRGALRLEAPLWEYDPRFAELHVHVETEDGKGDLEPLTKPLTIRDLLRHTSGFTYGNFGLTEVDRLYRLHKIGKRHRTLEENCGELAKLPLVHQPGTKFRYGVSTDVLGHVIERVSGKSLAEFLHDEIFEPLGMVDTGFHLPSEKLGRFAANYGPQMVLGGLRRIGDPATSRYLRPPKMLSGGGGLLSTADDFMQFCNMLVARGEFDGGRILKSDTVAEMMRNQIDARQLPIQVGMTPFPGVGFGLGVSVRVNKVDYAPYIPVGEIGWSGIASTHFWVSLSRSIACVVLTQHMPFNPALADEVKRIVYTSLE